MPPPFVKFLSSPTHFLLIWTIFCGIDVLTNNIQARETATASSEASNITVSTVGAQCSLGEGPFWDAVNQVLYYVDIDEQKVHKYNPATKRDTSVKIENGQPSFVIPVKGESNKLLISMTRSLAVVTWDGESSTPDDIQVIVSVEDDKPNHRFNDGKADHNGTLWAGTMIPVTDRNSSWNAAFYSFQDLKSPVKQIYPVGESNGLVWTRDMKLLYYIDTLTYTVEVFDLDFSTGNLSNRRTVIDFNKEGRVVRPDGMTMDTEGKLWLASANKSEVLRIDPEAGVVLETIAIPSQKVSSVTFGGPDLDQLYVTTTRNTATSEQLEQWPLSGFTFLVTGLGVHGYPGDRVSYNTNSTSGSVYML